MPKQPSATLTVTSGPGPYHQGDIVTFDLAPDNAGPITAYGYDEGGVVRCAWANILGDEDMVLGASQSWLAHPGPLHVVVQAVQVVHGKVAVIAETTFEIAS
jgi:hypothetical protein